ncbi:MAG: hypothetical protein ABSA14_15015, partial [Acidimicrobiales bacterium]
MRADEVVRWRGAIDVRQVLLEVPTGLRWWLRNCRREVAQRPGPSSPDGCPVVVVEEVEPLGVDGECGTRAGL